MNFLSIMLALLAVSFVAAGNGNVNPTTTQQTPATTTPSQTPTTTTPSQTPSGSATDSPQVLNQDGNNGNKDNKWYHSKLLWAGIFGILCLVAGTVIMVLASINKS